MQAEGPPPIDMVIVSSLEDTNRSNKALLASILSYPVVKPSWLEACRAKKECVSLRGHLWQELKEQWQGFTGLKVYIYSTALQRRIKTLLQYAGEMPSSLCLHVHSRVVPVCCIRPPFVLFEIIFMLFRIRLDLA